MKYSDDPPLYAASVYCSRARYGMATAKTVAFAVDFYNSGDDVYHAAVGGAGRPRYDAVFDANGVDVLDGQWHRFETVGPSPGDKATAWIGRDPPGYVPAWCDPAADADGDPATGESRTRGFNNQGYYAADEMVGIGDLGAIVGVVRFDVPGGFDMVP